MLRSLVGSEMCIRDRGTTLSILRAFIACAAAVQTAVLVLVGPSCLGHNRPLQRRFASDKCSVRCRPTKQRQNLPQLLIKTYLRLSTFLPFFQKRTANIAFGTIFERKLTKSGIPGGFLNKIGYTFFATGRAYARMQNAFKTRSGAWTHYALCARSTPNRFFGVRPLKTAPMTVKFARPWTCFLGWICTRQILHNISLRQARI